MDLINEFCQRHDFNGQIKEDLINTFQIFINERSINAYRVYNRGRRIKSIYQENINWIVCWYFNLEPQIVFNESKRSIILIRQIAQYFGKLKGRDSNAVIGYNTGDKDGSTVDYSYKKINSLVKNPRTPYNQKLADDINEISKRL